MSRSGGEGRDVERAYDRLARVYDFFFDPVCYAGRRRAVERLRCVPGDRVLEVGFGTGASLGDYPPGVKVVGTDLSREMLRRAVDRIDPAAGSPWGLVRMDALSLGFADESFDKVVAFHVISVLPDPVGGVEEMKRVCRPGGDLIILNHFHSPNPLVRGVEKAIDPLTRRIGWSTTLEMQELIEATDLDVCDVEPVNLFGYWRLVHARKGRDARGRAL